MTRRELTELINDVHAGVESSVVGKIRRTKSGTDDECFDALARDVFLYCLSALVPRPTMAMDARISEQPEAWQEPP